MRKMQLLAPELKALKEKYKDDKQRQQEEMMKLYREKGINPFASCLPLVLQLPVFISLFYMLRTDLKKHICGRPRVALQRDAPRGNRERLASAGQVHRKDQLPEVAPHSAKFLFVPDITAKATGVVLIVLIVLYVASQVISTLLMSASAEPSQRWMMLGLAADLRSDPLQVSGGPPDLLDHHQRVDDRPGLHRAAAHRTTAGASRQGDSPAG